MKALVTGATGFIGSHVVDKLIEMGFSVVCNVRKSSDLRWLKDKPIELIDAPLNNKSLLSKAVEGVDYVFHIAGVTFARNYNEFLIGNFEGTKNLLTACSENNPSLKRFVFVSSLTVVGPAKSLDCPVNEETICNPLTSYGKSKKAAEDEVIKFKDIFPVTIIRAPAVYGPRDTAILSVFQAVKMGLGTIVGFNKKYLSLIHSDDLSRGIIEAGLSENTAGEIYFVSSNEFYTWEEVIPLMAELIGKKFVLKLKLPHLVVLAAAGISEFIGKFSKKPPVFNYEKGIDFIQDYWICSIDKAKRDFNYFPKMSIENGIKNTIDWYKSHGWL